MNLTLSKSSSLLKVITILQVITLLIYLNANIVNVGEMGTALPLLIGFVSLSVVSFLMRSLSENIYVRIHLAFFLLLMSWIALRVILDLNDLEYLKQITVATTGGMLLFYVLGSLLGLSYHTTFSYRSELVLEKLVVSLFFLLVVWMLYNFSHRLHDTLFYLEGVDGNYQRSGNFLSISFVLVSFSYISLVLKRTRNHRYFKIDVFWLAIYTLSTILSLISSQLFGSNSATAVILGIYLITLVMAIIIPQKNLWLSYLRHQLALPWSKRLFRYLILMALVGLAFFVGILTLIISLADFDITSIRLLGFGSGNNTSLQSRIDILMETGANQLGYAPFLGNMNVAYLRTGNAGETLHSFLPYVMANLGLVGVTIVITLFASVFYQIYRDSKWVGACEPNRYGSQMIAIYSVFILLYILLFANLATGVSWAVLWFTLGFISKPFGFK